MLTEKKPRALHPKTLTFTFEKAHFLANYIPQHYSLYDHSDENIHDFCILIFKMSVGVICAWQN
jgi:hypothetical protein